MVPVDGVLECLGALRPEEERKTQFEGAVVYLLVVSFVHKAFHHNSYRFSGFLEFVPHIPLLFSKKTPTRCPERKVQIFFVVCGPAVCFAFELTVFGDWR
jgi:hypothetical protein